MVFIFLLLICVSCFWIYKSCNLFEKGSIVLSQNMAPGLKGATVTAIGSSLPEFIISFLFLFIFRDELGFATSLATVVGSSVFNLLVIPGFSLVVFFSYGKIKKVKIQKSIVLRDSFFFILSLVLLFVFLNNSVITWKIGFALVFVYILYTLYLVIQQKKFSNSNIKKVVVLKSDLIKNWFKIFLSVVQVVVACYILAESVIQISILLKLNPYFVSIILSASATSIPDLFLSIRDAKKGNIDDSLSNAIGSNIFDICIALGLSVFIYTLVFSSIRLESNIINLTELKTIILLLIVSSLFCFVIPKFFQTYFIFIFLGLYIIFLAYYIFTYLFQI